MSWAIRIALAATLLAQAGCATDDGGGPLGFVLFDKNRQVAAAEPLFNKEQDKCFESPGFLLSILIKDESTSSGAINNSPPTNTPNVLAQSMNEPNVPARSTNAEPELFSGLSHVCRNLRRLLARSLGVSFLPGTTPADAAAQP